MSVVFVYSFVGCCFQFFEAGSPSVGQAGLKHCCNSSASVFYVGITGLSYQAQHLLLCPTVSLFRLKPFQCFPLVKWIDSLVHLYRVNPIFKMFLRPYKITIPYLCDGLILTLLTPLQPQLPLQYARYVLAKLCLMANSTSSFRSLHKFYLYRNICVRNHYSDNSFKTNPRACEKA